MKYLLKLSGLIDALNERVGRVIMWLILVAVLLSAGNAIARKVFRMSSNALSTCSGTCTPVCSCSAPATPS